MAQIFISHANEDAAVAQRIVAYLEAHGAPCWISSRDIQPRAIYADAIAEAMQSASACAVIVSAASNSSKAVKRELELASHYDKPFIPIRIDATEPAAGVDYYLRNTQWVDYAREGERALDRIVGKGSISPPAPRAAAQPKPRPSSSSMQQSQSSGSGKTLMIAAAILLALGGAGAYLALTNKTDAQAFLVGDYNWDGVTCGAGPHVTEENGELVFTMTGQPTFRHRPEGEPVTDQGGYAVQIATSVIEPAEHAGERYLFRAPTLRAETLEVVTGEETNIWIRCRVGAPAAAPETARASEAMEEAANAVPSLADSFWTATWGEDNVRVPWHFYADGRACAIYASSEVCDWRWEQSGDAITIRSGGETWSGRFSDGAFTGELRQAHTEELRANATPRPFRLEPTP